MYMMNRPEFLFAHLGLWSIGASPAWINYNLAGDALVHCLKVAGAKVLLVDEDSACRQRIEDIRERLENELGMTIKVLDQSQKGEISRSEPKRPDNEMRKNANGKFPLFLFYTRYVSVDNSEKPRSLLRPAARLATPKLALSKLNAPSV